MELVSHAYRTRLARCVVAALLATMFAAASPAQTPESVPTTRNGGVDAQRAMDLLLLIEGPNSPQARLTGARELLRLEWPETPVRFVIILRGANAAAKTAISTALADLPQYLLPQYIEPLIGLLDLADEPPARSAGAALAAFIGGESISALRAYVLDTNRPSAGRFEAIRALGLMTHRDAIGFLAELLDTAETAYAEAALAALEQATGMQFGGDRAAARRWWETNRGATRDQWQGAQIRRLLEQNRQKDAAVLGLEARLSGALRERYARAAETERAELLTAYLSDPLLVVRLLAIDLVQADIAEGRTIQADAVAAVRSLLADADARVRAAAVRAIAGLREPSDGDAFVLLLSAERESMVRLALISALGYLGGSSAIEPLLALLSPGDVRTASAAVAALGRLAERGILEGAARERLIAALLSMFPQTPREATELRERTLWAMSRIPDPRFADHFVAALDPAEAANVRQAAVRGLVVLADPRLNDRLIQASRDPDAAVRQIAVEALAKLTPDDQTLAALWARLAPPDEPDETVRDTAWSGALRMIQERSNDELESWLARLPGSAEFNARRAIELLQILETRLAAAEDQRSRLGRVRARLAERHAALGQIDVAIAVFLRAIEDLHAAADPEQEAVVVALLRCVLPVDRYDAQIAASLTALNPPLNAIAIWDGVRGDIECRLNPTDVDRAIGMLLALQSSPPALLPSEVRNAIAALLKRGRDLRGELDAATVHAALVELRSDESNVAARAAILHLGTRAVPALCDALRVVIDADPVDVAFERMLHDVLTELLPDWAGFAADASPHDKRGAIDAALQLVSGPPAQPE